MKAVKDAAPGCVVEDECLDICGGGSYHKHTLSLSLRRRGALMSAEDEKCAL